MQWVYTYVCHRCRYISSSCLAAGAEGGDGILGSAPPPTSCRGAAKHRQVWSNRMCWEGEGCHFERSLVFTYIPERYPAAQWCHSSSHSRCCLVLPYLFAWLGECGQTYFASLQLKWYIYIQLMLILNSRTRSGFFTTLQYDIKYIVSTAEGVSSFRWGVRDVDAVSPHSGAFYHVCGVKMISQPTWSPIADYYYGLVNWENPVWSAGSLILSV